MYILELAGNTSRINAVFRMVDILLRRQLLQSHLILNLNGEKEEVLTWRNTKQVKSYIDNNLNPLKVNVIDPTKDNFTQPLSVQEILDELEISNVEDYRTLSISNDEDFELHLKRKPNSYFVNN